MVSYLATDRRRAEEERVRTALAAVFCHNFRRMSDVPTKVLRAFTINDERGVLYANFPRSPGELLPLIAVHRSHEVYTGCEYAIACLLVQEGLIAEGQAVVDATRARHDGSARNPWNEPEAGDHYARALASYGFLQAHARSRFDLSRGRFELSPQVNRHAFSTFFAIEGAWVSVRLDERQLTFDLAAGRLLLRELVVDGRSVPVPQGAVAAPGRPLTLPILG